MNGNNLQTFYISFIHSNLLVPAPHFYFGRTFRKFCVKATFFHYEILSMNLLFLTSCPSMLSTSNSPMIILNPGFGATQPFLLGLLR